MSLLDGYAQKVIEKVRQFDKDGKHADDETICVIAGCALQVLVEEDEEYRRQMKLPSRQDEFYEKISEELKKKNEEV